jgi:endonuclease/exonuclease/phosphatase family metal-dependent hydrolase
VLTFNVLKGGALDGKPLSRTRDVILASEADVVGVQESDGNASALAALLGWDCRVFSFDRGNEMGNVDVAILSRFPITQTLVSGVRVQVAPNEEAYVFTAHPNAYPYQPYDIRDGKLKNEPQTIRAAQDARGPQIVALIREVKPYIDARRAVFVTGDFNEPSHLDWTTAADEARLHAFKVAWPASTALVAAGLRDSYRQVHPNAVKSVANTWTSVPENNEVHDRIDFVYWSGSGVSVTDSRILGESATAADLVIDKYPSDHRAVVSTFSVPLSTLAPVRLGVNLISNPGAEANPATAAGADRVITDWEKPDNNTTATAQLYGKDGYAAAIDGGGRSYFYGGDTGATVAESHSISQAITISEAQSSNLDFELSGSFGGYADQDDAAALTAAFLDNRGGEIEQVTIGNVTAKERKNVTTLLERRANGRVPSRCHAIRFTLTFTKSADGTRNDASTDNLAFVMRAASGAGRKLQ